MSYFSRLTEIVTCNLSELLNRTSDPREALPQIIREMEEGVAGARRSVQTATSASQKLTCEIQDHQNQLVYWNSMAKQELGVGNEDGARLALLRKKQVDDLIAALQKEHIAAEATRDHLLTIQRAVEARLADARRRLVDLEITPAAVERREDFIVSASSRSVGDEIDDDLKQEIDEELSRLRRELQS